jgi:hypothetical protein
MSTQPLFHDNENSGCVGKPKKICLERKQQYSSRKYQGRLLCFLHYNPRAKPLITILT